MKQNKRICALALVILMAFSIGGCFQFPTPTPDVTQSATQATSADAAFDAFVDGQFLEDIQDSYIDMHFSFEHPENYGLDPQGAEVVISENQSEENAAAARELLQQRAEQFAQFDRSLLSADRQDAYDIYQYALDIDLGLSDAKFDYYGSAFETASGMHVAIPQLLTGFVVRSEQDAADLAKVVRSVRPYMQSILEYTKKQAEQGTLMVAIDEVAEYCQDILDSGEDGDILKTMQANVDALNLPAQTAEQYKQELKAAFRDSFLPAYQDVVDTLSSLKDAPNNTLGLAALPDGKEFYEHLFKQATGTSRSIEETRQLLTQVMEESVIEMQKLAKENPEAVGVLLGGGDGSGYADYESMLSDLEVSSKRNFPEIGAVKYEIKPVDKGTASDSIAAYYLIPALDGTTPQQIRVNGDGDTESLDLFSTIAHEGFPGHLYQTNYAHENLDSLYRRGGVSFPGYSEGYATYAERLAMGYLEHVDETARRMQNAYSTNIYCALSLADIGIHYDGWTLDEAGQFLEDAGLTLGEEGLAATYDQLQQNPTIFLPYHVGYAEFRTLRKAAEEALGDKFEEMAFHEAILKSGDAPFDVVKRNVNAYVTEAGGRPMEDDRAA